MPDRLAKGCVAVGMEASMSICPIAVEKIAGNSRRVTQQPVSSERAIFGDRFSGNSLGKPIQTRNVVHQIRSIRGYAELLTVLVLTRGNMLHGLYGQAGVVAIIRSIPVPPAPGAHRSECDRAKIPVGDG